MSKYSRSSNQIRRQLFGFPFDPSLVTFDPRADCDNTVITVCVHTHSYHTLVLQKTYPGILCLPHVCVHVNRGLQKEELVLLTHGDSVDKVADGFKVVAQSGIIIAGEQQVFFSNFTGTS